MLAQGRKNRCGYRILKHKAIFDFFFEHSAPFSGFGRGFNKLCVDPEALATALYTSRENIRHTQRPANFFKVRLSTFKGN